MFCWKQAKPSFSDCITGFLKTFPQRIHRGRETDNILSHTHTKFTWYLSPCTKYTCSPSLVSLHPPFTSCKGFVKLTWKESFWAGISCFFGKSQNILNDSLPRHCLIWWFYMVRSEEQWKKPQIWNTDVIFCVVLPVSLPVLSEVLQVHPETHSTSSQFITIMK